MSQASKEKAKHLEVSPELLRLREAANNPELWSILARYWKLLQVAHGSYNIPGQRHAYLQYSAVAGDFQSNIKVIEYDGHIESTPQQNRLPIEIRLIVRKSKNSLLKDPSRYTYDDLIIRFNWVTDQGLLISINSLYNIGPLSLEFPHLDDYQITAESLLEQSGGLLSSTERRFTEHASFTSVRELILFLNNECIVWEKLIAQRKKSMRTWREIMMQKIVKRRKKR